MNGETLTFRKPTLILEGTVLPWKVRMMVAVVILFPSFVIIILCASLTPCSLRLSTMSSTDDTLDGIQCSIPANTKYFQNIFKRTEKKLLETFTINMNKTLAKCSITIGKTLLK